MKSKKIYLIIALAVVLSMSACGKKKADKDNVSDTEISTEEETENETDEDEDEDKEDEGSTEETTAKKTAEVTTKKPVEKKTVKSSEIGKSTADAEPKTDAASPVAGVSNALFLDVSNVVREQANNSYREILQDYFLEDNANEAQDIRDVDATLEDWKKLYKDSSDKAYAETAHGLIMAYSRLAALDNIIDSNMDRLNNEILAEHDRIAFDLQGNVEIFLNASNISSIAADKSFSCLDRIAQLRSKVESELNKPVNTEAPTEAQSE